MLSVEKPYYDQQPSKIQKKSFKMYKSILDIINNVHILELYCQKNDRQRPYFERKKRLNLGESIF